MITVEEATTRCLNAARPFGNPKYVDLIDSLDYHLAEDIISPIDMPPFRQSAMDGYAVRLSENQKYTCLGEIKAGDSTQPILQKSDAYRIFTGAAVPPTADAVVMQEHVTQNESLLHIDSEIKLGMNIRPQGSQTQKDSVALEKGTHITPAAIGFLATLGITKALIYPKPSIGIIVTGNELIKPGADLKYGQIYESNSIMVHAALSETGYNNITHYKVEDNFDQTLNVIQTAIDENDLIIITGGISVGKYDYVGKALNKLNVEQVFYKVKQKPGKPLFFGKKTDKLIFGLPGNPASVLTCFHIYVRPVLKKMTGAIHFKHSIIKTRLADDYERKGERSHFLKARVSSQNAQILGGQSSAILQSFAQANALLYIPAPKTSWDKGDYVDTILI